MIRRSLIWTALITGLVGTVGCASPTSESTESNAANIEEGTAAADRAHGMALIKADRPEVGQPALKELPVPEVLPDAVAAHVKFNTRKWSDKPSVTQSDVTLGMYEIPGYGPHFMAWTKVYDRSGDYVFDLFETHFFDAKGTNWVYSVPDQDCEFASHCGRYSIKVGDQREIVNAPPR